MGQSRVPVKGVGYLRQTDMDTPLYGGVLMSIGYLAIFLKNFFVVAVRGKLSVVDLTDASANRGGSYPIHPITRTIVKNA